MRRFGLALLILLLASPTWAAQAPALLGSNALDGAITGWEQSATKGAAITIYGRNFGSSRGSSTVTACGQTLSTDANFGEWGANTNPVPGAGVQRIVFFLNSSMTPGAGTISVTTADGTSGTIPFTCRALGGNSIYFFSRSGSDSNNGLTVATAFLTFTKARTTLTAGDAAYFKAGVYNEQDSNFGAVLNITGTGFTNGAVGTTVLLSAYPGELAVCGDTSRTYCLRVGGSTSPLWKYWTLSNFFMTATTAAITWNAGSVIAARGDEGLRFVGNEMTATNGATPPTGGTIFQHSAGGQASTNFKVLFNNMRDTPGYPGTGSGTRAYGYYPAGYGIHNGLEVGWNTMAYNSHGRGVQFYCHLSGDAMDNVLFHHNRVHHNGMTGIIAGGGDGSSAGAYTCLQDAVFWGNVIASNGIPAGATTSTEGNYPGVFIPMTNGTANDTHQIWQNNTFFENYTAEIDIDTSSSGAAGTQTLVFTNNLMKARTSSQAYLDAGARGGATCSYLSIVRCSGSNNLFYGGTSEPAWDTAPVSGSDPLFVTVSPVSYLDFQLQSGSPAIGAGTSSVDANNTTDFLGIGRPQNTTWDIGAFEFDTGGGLPADTTAPSISALSAGTPDTTAATITFTTDEPGTTQLDYGLTASYGTSTTLDSNLVTSHSVALSGLTHTTTYHYRVKSQDASGNLATTSDQTFVTATPPDVVGPVISNISVTAVTSSQATISYVTDEPSDTQCDYGLTDSYGTSTTLDNTDVTSHSCSLTGMTGNTVYHFRVKSRDPSGNLTTGGDNTLTTTLDSPTPQTSGRTDAGTRTAVTNTGASARTARAAD